MARPTRKRKTGDGRARLLRGNLVAAGIVAGVLVIILLLNKRVREIAKDESDELLPIQWRQTSPGSRPFLEPQEPGEGSSPVAFAADQSTNTALRQEMALANPTASGWESEALSESASVALKTLAKAMLAPHEDALWTNEVAALIAEEFTCDLTLPVESTPLFDDGVFSVRRSIAPSDSTKSRPGVPSDLGGFRRLAAQFVGAKPTESAARLTFKIEGIAIRDQSFETRVSVELVRRDAAGGSRQQNAVWNCEWDKPTAERATLRVRSIIQTSQEEVYRTAPGPIFQDCTLSAMAQQESFRAQFLRGNAYWAQRLSILEGTSFLGHHGLTIGDVNGDRLDDLYVCDGGGLPNRLYLQNKDGTLLDVSLQSGVDWLEYTPAALLVDLDNDGDQDLVLATVAMILFMKNDGDGKFALAGAHSGVAQARSMCAGDYDGDGDLDLFVCSYTNPNKATGFGNRGVTSTIPSPYHDANNGSPNALLENHGKFRFAEVTKKVGLDENNSRFSFAASWEDYDLDGDLDLYVANDFGRNCLYRNEDGMFRDLASELGVEDTASGMSVSWGDCNGDGRPDLYVGNMYSAAGQRITYQRRFEDKREEAQLRALRRMARGNTLFLGNEKGGPFSDVSEAAHVTMGRWAWSSLFTDLNNDGRLDLVVGNGFLTNRKADDL